MSKHLDLLDRSVPPGKMIIMLAWPVFIEQLMQIMVGYVDTAMVAALGIDATASVSVNNSFVFLTMGLILGIGTGYSVLVSRAIGAGRPDYAKDVIRQSMHFILGMGLFMMFAYIAVFSPNLATMMNAEDSIKENARDYLRILGYSRLFYVSMLTTNNIHRGAGNTRIPMASNLTNNLLNICGNFLLIYPTRTISVFGLSFRMWGAGLGVRGAAIATSLACAVAALISFAKLYDSRFELAISLKDNYKFKPGMLKDALSIGVPVALDRIIISGGQMIITRLCAGLGNATLAAHNFATTAESICYMPILGFMISAQTLVAASLGAKDAELAKRYQKTSLKYAVGIMSFSAAMLYIFAPNLIGFFTKEPEVLEMAVKALRIQAFAEPCFAVAAVYGGVLKGAGDVRFSVYVSVIGMWCVRIMLALVLVNHFGMGLNGVWIPMALDWLARAAVFTLRIRSGKWQTAWKIKEV